MYHAGNRKLLGPFGSTPPADHPVEKTLRTRFADDERPFIQSVTFFFFLATADPGRRPG